jgi:uncharacterized phage protein gp47/JayE
MAVLNTQSLTTTLQNWAAAVQGACSLLLDFTVGSILRAIGQAQAGVALWLQGLILQLLATTRLATCKGNDVDTFCVDFMPALPGSVTAALPNGSPRLPAVAATGAVTFARFTPTNSAFIPAQSGPVSTPNGAVMQTLDGTQSFVVVADPNQSAYSASLNGYVIPANVSSVAVTVQALNAGTGGNISAGTLTVLQTGISGVDTVTNAGAFSNGINQESDAALKARFPLYMASLAEGTNGAIAYAITSLQQGLQYTINNNVDLNGSPDNGMVTVIVDDGSGSIPGALVALASSAVHAVIAAGVRVGVYAATKVTVPANLTITTAAGFVHATVVAQVAAAIAAYINGIGLGNSLSYGALYAVAFSVAGVTDVTNYTLNGGTADIAATSLQTIKAGTITVA